MSLPGQCSNNDFERGVVGFLFPVCQINQRRQCRQAYALLPVADGLHQRLEQIIIDHSDLPQCLRSSTAQYRRPAVISQQGGETGDDGCITAPAQKCRCAAAYGGIRVIQTGSNPLDHLRRGALFFNGAGEGMETAVAHRSTGII